MESNKPQFVVVEDFYTRKVRVYLEYNKQGVQTVIGIDKKGALISQTIDPLTPMDPDIRPLFETNATFIRDFVEAVCEYASKDKKKYPQGREFVEGKLEATQNHLEDVRKYLDLTLNKLTKTSF